MLRDVRMCVRASWEHGFVQFECMRVHVFVRAYPAGMCIVNASLYMLYTVCTLFHGAYEAMTLVAGLVPWVERESSAREARA